MPLPNADYLGFEATPGAIIGTAVKAEDLGFGAFSVNDHIVVDNAPRSVPWTLDRLPRSSRFLCCSWHRRIPGTT